MSPEATFLASFAVTLVILGGVVFTGLRKQRRRHLPLVALAVLSLAVTIYFAERLGETLDIQSAGMIATVHLALAKIVTLLYLAPLATGILTLRTGRGLRRHRTVAFTVLVMTVLTAVTGAWMAYAADPLEPVREGTTSPAADGPASASASASASAEILDLPAVLPQD